MEEVLRIVECGYEYQRQREQKEYIEYEAKEEYVIGEMEEERFDNEEINEQAPESLQERIEESQRIISESRPTYEQIGEAIRQAVDQRAPLAHIKEMIQFQIRYFYSTKKQRLEKIEKEKKQNERKQKEEKQSTGNGKMLKL